MLKLIKKLLLKIVDDIDAGNSNISEEEATQWLDVLKDYTKKDSYISKYTAYKYLNMSRAKFDNLVKENKLPKGKKVIGFKELVWTKKDLDNAIEKLNSK